jgi:hypothetical protein
MYGSCNIHNELIRIRFMNKNMQSISSAKSKGKDIGSLKNSLTSDSTKPREKCIDLENPFFLKMKRDTL